MASDTNKAPLPVMSHFVAYYPDRDRSMAVAQGLVEGGAKYLEVQFPFSDPSADGPPIQRACQAAIDGGFKLEKGWRFLQDLTANTSVPVFLMTYAAMAVSPGVGEFVDRAAACGVTGLIIPDLPIDQDEGLLEACDRRGVSFVPVFPVTIKESRLQTILARQWDYFYVSLRSGITGTKTELSEAAVTFIDRLGRQGSRVMAGFGVQTRSQVESVAPHVDAVIVGSALVNAVAQVIQEGGSEALEPIHFRKRLRSAMAELTGIGKSSYVSASWK